MRNYCRMQDSLRKVKMFIVAKLSHFKDCFGFRWIVLAAARCDGFRLRLCLNVAQSVSLYSSREDGTFFKFAPKIKDPLGELRKEFEVAAISESVTVFPIMCI